MMPGLEQERIEAAAKVLAHRYRESFTGRILDWDELTEYQQWTCIGEARAILSAAGVELSDA